MVAVTAENFCRRHPDSLFGPDPKSNVGYQIYPRLFRFESMVCAWTLKREPGIVGCQYVKWALPNFFSIGVEKLRARENVLNQKGLFDFAPAERLFEAAIP
jgi:hypothetical protein